MRVVLPVFVLSLFFTLAGFSAQISVMNYNVENLFDTKHDLGKEDYTYLPKALKDHSPKIQKYCNALRRNSWKKSCLHTDWTQKILNSKLTNLTQVIATYNNGKGADVLTLQEVENIDVLKEWMKKDLRKMGYKYIALLEGDDLRGIDNAVISKFPIVKAKLHQIDISDHSDRPTRPILEVVIEHRSYKRRFFGKRAIHYKRSPKRIKLVKKEINKKTKAKTLKIFVNHWPSQGGPSELRYLAAQKLAQISGQSSANATIAIGDFNTLDKDTPHGINEVILPLYRDIHAEALTFGLPVKNGTHWYKGSWSRLDRVFELKTNNSKTQVILTSFNVIERDFLFTDLEWTNYETGEVTVYKNVPYRFKNKTGKGYSDHLPLVFKVSL